MVGINRRAAWLAPLRWFLRQNLAVQILEGLVAGILVGRLLPATALAPLSDLGDGFIRLFQMPVLPFLSISLIAGVGRLQLGQASRLLGRSALVLLSFWLVVLLAVLLVPQPLKSLPAARQLPWDSAALAGVWNSWLRFQDMDGTRQTVYRHWVEGVELHKNRD